MQELTQQQKEILVDAMIRYYEDCVVNERCCCCMCSFIESSVLMNYNFSVSIFDVKILFPEFSLCRPVNKLDFDPWFDIGDPEPRLKFSIELKEKLTQQK